jgi:hypothetical protein
MWLQRGFESIESGFRNRFSKSIESSGSGGELKSSSSIEIGGGEGFRKYRRRVSKSIFEIRKVSKVGVAAPSSKVGVVSKLVAFKYKKRRRQNTFFFESVAVLVVCGGLWELVKST